MTKPLTATERQRLRTSVNLWRALIPIVVLVVVMVVFLWPHGNSAVVRRIDLNQAITEARAEIGFAPLAPTGLPTTWRATSDTVVAPEGSTPGSLLLGFLTPSGKYAELFESNDNVDAVSAQYGPLQSTTPVTVSGTPWDGFQTTRNRQLIRHTFTAVTVIITGSASQAELVTLAASVR